MGPNTDKIVRDYLVAKREVVEGGFVDEIAWQIAVRSQQMTSQSFVREAAWVVLSAGMSETVVRRVFARIAKVAYNFDPLLMTKSRSKRRDEALGVFNHVPKIDAIYSIASMVVKMDEIDLRARLEEDAEAFLCSLPYIGSVTWRHLAKNLGYQVAKPDRHLVRIASVTSRMSVDVLCREISDSLNEPVAVVDVVLWRWSVMHVKHCRNMCGSVLH